MCNDNSIETIEKDKIIIKIYQDDMAESPREWSNLGHMACFHRRYNLGDEHIFQHEIKEIDARTGYEDFYMDDPRGLMEYVDRDDVIALPLYLYDHSGISMSTCSFIGRAQHAEWDSGMVGYIYITKAEACKEYGWKRMTKKREQKILRYLEGEVKAYDHYLTGSVYGYHAICKNCGEEIDSCWGFYGDHETSGLLEQASYAECVDCKDTEKRMNQLAFQFVEA